MKRRSPSLKPAAWLLASLASVALVALVLTQGTVKRAGAPGSEAAVWSVAAGKLLRPWGSAVAEGPLAPGRYEAQEAAELSLGLSSSSTWSVSRGSVIEVLPGRSLPRVLSGSIAAALDPLEAPILHGTLEFAAVAPARLVIDPSGLLVSAGSLRAGGRAFGRGARLFSRAGEPVALSPLDPAVESEIGEAGMPAPRRAGAIVDAASGAPISGVRVRATFFRGTASTSSLPDDSGLEETSFEAALDLSSAATYPSLHVEFVETDADGTFSLLPFEPEDPRISVLIQADHPGYIPRTAVISRRSSPEARWLEVDVRLRRAATSPVEVVDPDGKPLPHVPIQVTRLVDGYSFLEKPVLIGSDGRLLRGAEPELLFTDEDGFFRLPFSERPHAFELLHPFQYLHHRNVDGEQSGRVLLIFPPEGTLRLTALPAWVERHVLLDADGLPAADADIEVKLDGMPPLRLRTDEDGWFSIGVHPLRLRVPPSYSEPRRGRLTVFSPELLRHGADIAFPAIEAEVRLDGRRSPRLRFRTVAGENLEHVPLVPDGVEISLDLTSTRSSADGEVEFRGTLPAPGSMVDVYLPGWLPVRVVVPARGREEDDLDLGDIAFERGWTREIVLLGNGIDGSSCAGATLLVGRLEDPSRHQRHEVGESCTVVVGGLARGLYSFGVEGPRLKPFSGAIHVDEAGEGNAIEIPVFLTDEENVIVRGRVTEITPLEAARASVVERYFLAGRDEPLHFEPYPLASDGLFGSLRRLAGVRGAEIVILSPSEACAEARFSRGIGPPFFDAGEVRYRAQTRAEIGFTVEGLGRVAPPLQIALEGELGAERIARLRVKDRKLVADGLRSGGYTLRWRTDEGVEEVFGFEVEREHSRKVEGTAARSPLPVEEIEILVTDGLGVPLEGAHVSPAGTGAAGTPGEPGVVLAEVSPRKRNTLRVTAPERLPAVIEVEAGAIVPNQVPLYRGVTVVATLVDAGGTLVDGDVTVSWTPLTPTFVRHGAPVTARVERGRYCAAGLPPIPLELTLALGESGHAIQREWTLPEVVDRAVDLGTLTFEETRKIRGRVFLPDGSPAMGAIAALVERKAAHRFPLRGGGVERALYSTKTGPEGEFLFDAVPLRLTSDLTLLAHVHGYEDAVEDPLDLEIDARDLVLEPAAHLRVDAGYADGLDRRDYAFWLEHQMDESDPDSVVKLGEVAAGPKGGILFEAVKPGIYRLLWGLRKPYAPLGREWRQAIASPGTETRLEIRIEGREVHGRATFNGAEVERGWVLLTAEPGVEGRTVVGRIRNGRFTLLDPPEARRAHAAVIPERTPQSFQNIARGEALPVPVRDYRSALRGGRLDIRYSAFDLQIELGEDFLARNPGAVLSFDHHEWDRTDFRSYVAEEVIEAPLVRLGLLAPGIHRLSIRSARGSLILSRTVSLESDHTLSVR